MPTAPATAPAAKPPAAAGAAPPAASAAATPSAPAAARFCAAAFWPALPARRRTSPAPRRRRRRCPCRSPQPQRPRPRQLRRPRQRAQAHPAPCQRECRRTPPASSPRISRRFSGVDSGRGGSFTCTSRPAMSDVGVLLTGLPESAATAPLQQRRRASGVCGAKSGGCMAAASYTSCAPSGTKPAARAASSHARSGRIRCGGADSSPSLTLPRPMRVATSMSTATPAALQLAPSL